MKGKISILVKLVSLCAIFLSVTALPALAQKDCEKQLQTTLTGLPGIQNVVQENSKFLTILGTSDKTEVIKLVSRIKNIQSQTSSAGCNFGSYPIAICNSNLIQIKSKTADGLTNADLINLLFKHVYALNPIQVEENLKGYTRLSELAPKSKHYASRAAHYRERVALQKDRNEFIRECLKEAPKSKNIVDLMINRDIYLFITKNGDPKKISSDFLKKVSRLTPKPKKELCLFFYDSDLNRQGETCPAEYQGKLGNIEETLLMKYVQSIPSQKLDLNINGYKALKKLNPSSTLYTTKLDSYESKLRGLNNFLGVKTASGENLFVKSNIKRSTLFLTVNSNAIDGKPKKSIKSFYNMLSSYYSHSGRPYPRCTLKSVSGATLGNIQCNKKGQCTFK